MFVRRLSVHAITFLALAGSLLVLQPVSSTAYGAPVTVRGTYEVLAALSRTGEHELRAVRTTHGTFWLDLGTVRAPRAGAIIEVTGQQTSPRTIAASSLKVLTSARSAAVTPARDKVLVLRAYWGTRTPSRPTTTRTRSTFLAQGNAWFNEVSHGRYAISGTITPWLKIRRPWGCVESAYISMDRALTKARSLGYRPGRYSRFILYLPCDGGGIVGLGSRPGPFVWQFGSLDYDIALHEQGHNLGLAHANTRECTAGGMQVTWSAQCSAFEYADRFDVMGNRGDGHYQAYFKQRLGWLQRTSTLTSSATRTLSPYESTGDGFKAIRVKVSSTRSYWLEYRTRRGVDADFPPGSFGVQIRSQGGNARGGPQLLDAMPGSGYGFTGDVYYMEWDQVRLLPGSSWTSPEGIRFTTLSQTGTAARVGVTFRAGAPRAPEAPSSATATPVGDGALVSWTRPADNGSIITKYVVRASPGAVANTVRTVGGLVTSSSFGGLDPGTSYTFAVTAYNMAGASTTRISNPVTPTSTLPTVRLTAPAAGTVISGSTTVSAAPTPSPGTTSPISFVEFFADDVPIGMAFASPWSIEWDPVWIADGPVTLTAAATDQDQQSATSAGVDVTVDLPEPDVSATY